MRASFQKDLIPQESYKLTGDSAHHLINVIRLELNDEVLLLNGAGLQVKTKVSQILKREILLTQLDHQNVSRSFKMDLALGIPKKEALELSLKQAVELGFRKIYLIRSEYSQTRLPEAERLESLLISSLEQSNSSYIPEIIHSIWEEIPATEYGEILLMDSQSNVRQSIKSNTADSRLLIVGPEGGFSPPEIEFLHQMPGIKILKLPTPILRTPTAVSAGAGIILGSLLD